MNTLHPTNLEIVHITLLVAGDLPRGGEERGAKHLVRIVANFYNQPLVLKYDSVSNPHADQPDALTQATSLGGARSEARNAPRNASLPAAPYPRRHTLNSTPSSLHPQPYTLNPTPWTINPKPSIPNPKSETRNPKPETRNLKPGTRNPKPETQKTLNVKPETRNPEP